MLTDDAVVAAFPEYVIEPPPLGRGRIKIAYSGSDGETPVALKLLHQPLAADSEDLDESEGALTLPERIDREVRAMTLVESPRVVKILAHPEIREIEGERYVWFLERRYSKETLKTFLKGPWPSKNVIALMLDLLEAEQALAERGIVHRDIKPSNIVFDTEGRPVLLDLDSALHLEMNALTESHLAGPGTSRYAAPEQFLARRNATIDFRTDLFAIGVIGFIALTGRHPYHDGTIDYDRLVQGQFDKDALNQASCGDDLRRVITRLIAPTPNRRYRKLELVRADLEGAA